MRNLLPYVFQVGVIGAVDACTGADVTFWVLYLVPIGLATWNLGRLRGAAIALACLAAHLGTWIYAPGETTTLGAVMILCSRFVVFGLAVVVLSALRSKEVERVVVPPRSATRS